VYDPSSTIKFYYNKHEILTYNNINMVQHKIIKNTTYICGYNDYKNISWYNANYKLTCGRGWLLGPALGGNKNITYRQTTLNRESE